MTYYKKKSVKMRKIKKPLSKADYAKLSAAGKARLKRLISKAAKR